MRLLIYKLEFEIPWNFAAHFSARFESWRELNQKLGQTCQISFEFNPPQFRWTISSPLRDYFRSESNWIEVFTLDNIAMVCRIFMNIRVLNSSIQCSQSSQVIQLIQVELFSSCKKKMSVQIFHHKNAEFFVPRHHG